MSRPDIPTPKIAPARAAAGAPDNATIDGAGRRAGDQARAGAGTILTSGSGVTTSASTSKKTLLGE